MRSFLYHVTVSAQLRCDRREKISAFPLRSLPDRVHVLVNGMAMGFGDDMGRFCIPVAAVAGQILPCVRACQV
jgi:hypothetical protein